MPKYFPTQLEKLTASGYSANVTEAVNPDALERDASYILNLTDAAKEQIVTTGTLAVLLYQKQQFELAVQAGEDTTVDFEAPLEYQEILYELINMQKAYGVIGGTMLWNTAIDCPNIKVLSVAEARIEELNWGAAGNFCIPEDAQDNDKWLLAILAIPTLNQLIKDLISTGQLNQELIDFLKGILQSGEIDDELIDLIQKLINDGLITLPDTPPAPAADATPAGITTATVGTINYTKICGTPALIAHKDTTGLRSLLLVASSLVPIEIGPLNLRGAIDSYARLTFEDYKPRYLVSATFLLNGKATKHITATVPPAAPLELDYTNTPGLTHNATTDVFSPNGTFEVGFDVEFNSVAVGQELDLDIWKNAELTIGGHGSPLGCGDIIFGGDVTPVPLLVNAIEVAMSNQTGLDLYLTCLEIRSNYVRDHDVPFNLVASTITPNPQGVDELNGSNGTQLIQLLADPTFRNTNNNILGFWRVGSLTPSTDYHFSVKLKSGISLGSQTWYVTMGQGDGDPDVQIYTSPTYTVNAGTGGTIDIPFTTPSDIDDCNVYRITAHCTFPDIIFIEAGIH